MKSSEVYVDTGAFISLFDQSDKFHWLFLDLFQDPPKLITTPLVLAEGYLWLQRKSSTRTALNFLETIERLKMLSIILVDNKLLVDAKKLLVKFDDQPLSLTDAVGLTIVRERKIKTCWSVDRHLRLTGAELVIDK